MPLARVCVGEGVRKWTSLYFTCGSKLLLPLVFLEGSVYQKVTFSLKLESNFRKLFQRINQMNSKDFYHHKIYTRKNEIIKIYYKRTWKMLSLIYIIKHVTFKTIMWIYVFDMEDIHNMLLRNIKKFTENCIWYPYFCKNKCIYLEFNMFDI